MSINSIKTLLTTLNYEIPKRFVVPKAIPFDVNGLMTMSRTDRSQYTIFLGDKQWTLNTKIVLDNTDLDRLVHLIVRFAPPSSIVSLQPDTHSAGNVFVGMVMSWDDKSIPINLISGDIGCGITVLPFKSSNSFMQTDADCSYVLATIRQSLKRGSLAENGVTLNEFTKEASEFYGDSELNEWLDEMDYVLSSIGVKFEDEDRRESVLKYIGKYAQSLGSSGNHFMEIAVDDWGSQWMVVHSGSRGLGAEVYSVLAGACRFTTNGHEVATGNLATFYTRAYDALNKFAKLNRVICAISVLKNLGYHYRAEDLKMFMRKSKLFEPAINKCSESDILALMSGLTHNGMKAFVNHVSKEVLYVLCKGSIALSKRASAAIVALRAGDGCYLWTMVDASCNWEETEIKQALVLNYKVVYEADGVIYCGHGAGRSQSTRETAEKSTFEDVMSWYAECGIVGNIAPGVLGDNPRIAYKDADAIIDELPIEDACTHSQLRTRVTYKEGISYNASAKASCAEFIRKIWPHLINVTLNNRLAHRKLWMDLNLCRVHLTTEEFELMRNEQNDIIDEFKQM